jgi:hypothetical protein
LYLTTFKPTTTFPLVIGVSFSPLLGIAIAVTKISGIILRPPLLGFLLPAATAINSLASLLAGFMSIIGPEIATAVMTTCAMPNRHKRSPCSATTIYPAAAKVRKLKTQWGIFVSINIG